MLALKWLLMIVGAGLFGSAGALVAYDAYLSEQLRRLLSRNKADESGAEVGPLARRPLRPVRWRLAVQLTIAGALLLGITGGFSVIPDGAAGGARQRNFCHQTRRIADHGCRRHHYAAGERRNHREGSAAPRPAAPSGIRQGTRRAALEGTRKRASGHRTGDQGKASKDRRAGSGGAEST